MTTRTVGAAHALAEWAVALEPSAEDLALAERSLTDTVAVGLAARDHGILRVAASLSDVGRWAVACHILDFDDLHMETTTHISTVCVPVALAGGGDPRAYLAGAGVMARLGHWLGWQHYALGWHATTTTGALAAAATAAYARGFDAEQTARAMALAVPAAGGVQRSFGTDAKSLQVGFAVEAGIRAATLVEAGATADPSAVDTWLSLVGGESGPLPRRRRGSSGRAGDQDLPRLLRAAAPDRRGHGAGRRHRPRDRTPSGGPHAGGDGDAIDPLATEDGPGGQVQSRVRRRCGLLDEHPGFASFSDEAVARPEAQRLVELVDVELTDGGDGLLAGEVEVEVHTDAGTSTTRLGLPPGSPERPPTSEELARKIEDCLRGLEVEASDITWASGADLLRRHLADRSTESSTETSKETSWRA